MRMRDPQGNLLEVPDAEVAQATALGAVPDSAAAAPAAAAAGMQARNAAGESYLGRLRRAAPNALPFLGMMTGAGVGTLTSPFTGPVGPIAGAGIGAGVGDLARQALSGRVGPGPVLGPLDFGRAGLEAGIGAVGESGAQAVPWALRASAPAFMDAALTPGAEDYGAALATERRIAGTKVPASKVSLGKQAIALRVGPNAGGGAAKIDAAIGNLADQRAALIGSPVAAKQPFQITDVTNGDALSRLRQELADESDSEPKLAALDRMISALENKYRAAPAEGQAVGDALPIPAEKLETLKETWARQVQRIYGARARGQARGYVPPSADLRGRFNEALAADAGTALDRIPGVAELNDAMSRLYPLRDATAAAEILSARGKAGTLPFLPSMGILIPAFLRGRGTMAKLALRATGPVAQGTAQALPRSLAGLLMLGDNQGGSAAP